MTPNNPNQAEFLSGHIKDFISNSQLGNLKINKTIKNWEHPLLHELRLRDPVDLYFTETAKKSSCVVSISSAIGNNHFSTVAEKKLSNSIGSGYPIFYLKEILGLGAIPDSVTYSFIYKSACVVLEASNNNCLNALLVLTAEDFTDELKNHYQNFTKLFSYGFPENGFYKSNLNARANFYFSLYCPDALV